MSTFLALGSLSIVGFVPLILSIAAIVDVIRTGASWYWIPVVLFAPMIGSIAYFALTYTRLGGGRFASVSPASARRLQAQSRLRELSVQLAHWRGPAILAEAGDSLLVLGRYAEAEQHLREAQRAGAAPEEVSFPLAQALQMQGRFAEAVPLLEPLVRAKPDQRFGALQLHLARCLDESGRAADAESELRDLLVRRSFFEAQVRLARLLLRRGAADEAQRILEGVRASAAQLPRYLVREHRPWIRAARGLKTGNETLPRPLVEGAPRPGSRVKLALIALGALAAAAVLLVIVGSATGIFALSAFGRIAADKERAQRELAALDGQGRGPGPVVASLTDESVRTYLAVRAAVDPAALAVVTAREVAPPGDVTLIQRAQTSERAKIALLQKLTSTLRGIGMTPRELDGLFADVEWRCLERPEARAFGIPPHFRNEWVVASSEVEELDQAEQEEGGQPAAGMTPPPVDPARAEAARATLADIEKLAAATTLSPAAREVCARNRPRLEATDRRVLGTLACALSPELGCY